MISSDQATEIAKAYLAKLSIQMGGELVLAGPPKLEKERLLFAFNSKEYFETGDLNYALAGNFPFLVNLLTGEIEDFDGNGGKP